MRKLIDIPENILEDLKIMAVKAKMPLKNYIESILKELVAKSKSKASGKKG